MINDNYRRELEKDYEHWQKVFANGCNDPTWADGVNLNLIRNHIIYDKRKLEETVPAEELPELYYKELPPKVDPDYMAKPLQIMQNAVRYYETCTSMEEWDKLENAFDFLDENDSDQKSMRFFINRIHRLKEAIDSNDYVSMRRYTDLDDTIQKMKEYAVKLDSMELAAYEQMDLFSM